MINGTSIIIELFFDGMRDSFRSVIIVFRGVIVEIRERMQRR
jgi:hypothetical protein